MRHLIVALLLLTFIAVVRADEYCFGVKDAKGLTVDGRAFDPKTGRDTRQYAPDPQVDFVHLKLDLRMDDPAAKSFTCTETLTFKTPGRLIPRMTLDAVDLDIKSVTDLSGKPLDFRADDKRLVINFGSELPPHRSWRDHRVRVHEPEGRHDLRAA